MADKFPLKNPGAVYQVKGLETTGGSGSSMMMRTIGDAFPQTIENHLKRSEALIAVIGRRWLGISASDGDWVRHEIATALQKNILVVPVLVGGALYLIERGYCALTESC